MKFLNPIFVSSGSITGSLSGTSSYALSSLNSLSSSYSTTAGYSLSSLSSSYSVSSSNSISSSYSLTARSSSHALNSNNAISSSHAVIASSSYLSDYSAFATTSSFSVNSENATTSSLSLRSELSAIIIRDEGTTLTNSVSSINFVGSGIGVSNVGNAITITVDGTGGPGGSSTGANITGSFTNSDTWIVTHDLNYRLVTVQAYDTDYKQIVPSSIELTGVNQAVLRFPNPESGYAVVSLGGVPVTRASNIQRISGSSYSVQEDDYRIGVVYTLTGSFNLTLPLIANVGDVEYRVKDEQGNASINYININPSGADTIEDDTIFVINSNYGAIGLYNDGVSKWFIE